MMINNTEKDEGILNPFFRFFHSFVFLLTQQSVSDVLQESLVKRLPIDLFYHNKL